MSDRSSTKEDNIRALETYTTREILFAMLESLDKYHGIPFLDRTRRKLVSLWTDDLWWPNEVMVETVQEIFKKKHPYQQRYSSGGSWSPGGNYYVDVYECKLCGKLLEIQVPERGIDHDHDWKPDLMNEPHSHMIRCEQVLDIQKGCTSVEEFKKALLNRCEN